MVLVTAVAAQQGSIAQEYHDYCVVSSYMFLGMNFK